MKTDRIEKIKRLFIEQGPVLRTAVLHEQRVFSREIARLSETGRIEKVKRGYYRWNDDQDDLELVQALFPQGVISVFSAAVIHELTTVNPMSISITIPTNMFKPSLPEYPPVEIFFSAEEIMELGVEDYMVGNSRIRLYNKERTVCDFFKYRARVGSDIAMEVLKSYVSGPKCNLQKLMEYAVKLRVRKYIKPYVEALIQ